MFYAARFKHSSRRSQVVTVFQLVKIWATNTPNPFPINSLKFSAE